MSESLHVIIDLASRHEWPSLSGFPGANVVWAPAIRIAEAKRPTVLHCSRKVAEDEALRLQAAHPGGQFVIFTATDASLLIEAPTHVNLEGKILLSKPVARLAKVGDAEVFV